MPASRSSARLADAPSWPVSSGIRAQEKYSFLELVENPELAAEVTLQPIRRFGFDAAILFSDILVVPQALGQGFDFADQGGVKMDFTLRNASDIDRLHVTDIAHKLQYVAEALRLIKRDLGGRTALLGFARSPELAAS
jgi:uroporphyrinogen decarboxylase